MWACMYVCVLRVCTWPAFGPFGYLPHELKAGLIKAAQSVCECWEKREKDKEKKEDLWGRIMPESVTNACDFYIATGTTVY